MFFGQNEELYYLTTSGSYINHWASNVEADTPLFSVLRFAPGFI
jgi:hypothetical protein